MARNPYVGQRCSGRQAVMLMREINAIEHVLEQTISHLDVMIIIDISGSMQSNIDAVRAQVRDVSTPLTWAYGQQSHMIYSRLKPPVSA